MYYDPASAAGISAPTVASSGVVGQMCYSRFKYETSMASNANYWKLGMPVYQTFEITHDMDNQKVGFRALGFGSVTGPAATGASYLIPSSLLVVGLMSALY